jgi:putative addiction module component (TIGR02574 family)
MTTFERIADEALKLPPEERASLAEKLEQSLPLAGFASPEIAHAWATEVAGRIEAYERGETTAVNFDAAIERMRRRLAEVHERPDAK